MNEIENVCDAQAATFPKTEFAAASSSRWWG